MTRPCRIPVGLGEAGTSSDLPGPPPLTPLERLLETQTALLQQLTQAQAQASGNQQRGRRDNNPPMARYEDFLGTQPPLFAKADDPLEADAWVRAIESKFSILVAPCPEDRKASYAAQQLRGAALLWWDNYRTMLPADHIVLWDEFKTAFKAQHIPEGLVERKLNEFLALTQGTRTVLQYSQAFNSLCQYAGHHADTDAKKMERFRRGLSAKLKDRLLTSRTGTYSELVNLAIAQEDAISAHRAEKKRKAPLQLSTGQPSRFRLVPPQAPFVPRAPPAGRWVARPPSEGNSRFPPHQQQRQQQQGSRPAVSQPGHPRPGYACFRCGSSGHFI